MPAPRVPCVEAIIKDEAGRLLLIQRGHDPEAGRWSLPGGRIEPGESDEQAVVREIQEETGLRVTCGPLVGSVMRLTGKRADAAAVGRLILEAIGTEAGAAPRGKP